MSTEGVRITSGPDDPRQFVRIAVDLPFGTKVNRLVDPVVGVAAQVIAVCFAAQGFTDGHVPVNAVRRSGIPDAVIKDMVAEGFWHDEHSDLSACSRCQVPKPNSIYVHDYLRHQRSAQQARDLTEKRRAAGQASANKRWAPHREQQQEERAVVTKAAKAKGEESPVRPEVEMLCNGLANFIARNDSKGRRPTPGKAWYDDMRKMLDIDGFTVDELKDVISWTQQHPKWSNWVKSPHKLREQLKSDRNDLLGLMRKEGNKPGRNDARVQNALNVADELDMEFGDGDGGMAISA